MTDAETPLSGGRSTTRVVRLGDTIRRPHRPMVQALLLHLESRGFDAAPRSLGRDDKGRDILSFLPGAVPRELGPYTQAQLQAAARLLRRFHDATADFAMAEADRDWAEPLQQAGSRRDQIRPVEAGTEVICHNDWAPTNAVFRNGLPVGLIDFDTAAPGSRLWDLGYSAFTWLDLGNPDYSGETQIARLTGFAAGYAMPGCTIAAHAVARQTALALSGQMQRRADLADWAASAARWTILNVTERLLPTGYGLNGLARG